jgi:hypothetical protein
MKTDLLKKLIKESVREVIQEELRDIILEAIKSPKTTTVVTENINKSTPVNHDFKRNLRDLIGGDFSTISANSSHVTPPYVPPVINTTAEGSSLPNGEVSLDQIMGLMK